MASCSNVSVAVRIRPKLQREEIDMCNVCTRVTPGEPQVWLGHDKAFTFDHVFDMNSKQSEVYDACVKSLVEGCFDGFNATVLAYGQTGSGKTYTMGTGFDISYPEEQRGIIPRAVEHLFNGIKERQDNAKRDGLPVPEFTVTAQFIEIYNEEIIDLLSERTRKGNQIRIQEDFKKGIALIGAETKQVLSSDDTLKCLKSGSLFRTTGATLMNAESSRSHAIFTLFIKQNRVDRIQIIHDDEDIENNLNSTNCEQEVVTLTAKFNFVDLAGSERLSRTGAVGERAKEGISINSGLLHLGNVISALGDRTKRMTHIPYRDSKLTRVLQDSLGGNSVTTMIACISPCDRDFVETLNTLRYANRAKNIKNKIVANQDSQTQLINELRRQMLQLQLENQELRQGKLFVSQSGELELNDVYHENQMLQRELNQAQVRIKALTTRLDNVNEENINLNEKLAKIRIKNSHSSEDNMDDDDNNGEDYAESLIKGYLKEINNLRSKVVESDHLITNLRKQLNNQRDNDNYTNGTGVNVGDLIEKTKQDIELGKSYYLNQLNQSSTTSNTTTSVADTNGNGDYCDDNDNAYDSGGDDEDDLEKKLADHNTELANLIENLNSKERLIEEFEARERRIIELTEQYEQKITSFKIKIKQIEDERDILMQKIKLEKKDDNISKAKKEEYEKKLISLQNDVRKYEALKREHQKILKQETSSKERLKKLRQEILEAKQQRVKLIAQMREQMGKHNKEMSKNRLMINKLTREDFKKVAKIRDLEEQSNLQKKILRRREEEIKNLKKLVRPDMSDRVAGRFYYRRFGNGLAGPNGTHHGSTPQKARNKWNQFEQKFNKLVAQRLQFELEEKKLARYLQDRQKSIDLLNTLKENNNSTAANNDTGDTDPITNDDDLDALQTNIDYLSKCIEETQNVIMQLDEENLNIQQLFNSLDTDEVLYIMDKLTNSAINYAITASQHEEDLKEKDANLNNMIKENICNKRLLDYMLSNVQENNFYEDFDEMTTPSNDKFRKLTMTPAELLYTVQATTTSNSDTNNDHQNIPPSSTIKTKIPETIVELSNNDSSINNDNLVNNNNDNNNDTDDDANGNHHSNDIHPINSTFSIQQNHQDLQNQTFYVTNNNKNNDNDDDDDFSNHLNHHSNLIMSSINNNNNTSDGNNDQLIIPKSSLQNHVSNSSSLKELNNIPTSTSVPSVPKTAINHYLLSPHLLRRKIHQQQQQQQNSVNNNNYSPSKRLIRSISNNNEHQHLHQQYNNNNYNNNFDQQWQQENGIGSGGTPPGSPSINRKLQRELSNSGLSQSITGGDDVFSRLTTGTTVTNPIEYSTGQILQNNVNLNKQQLLDKTFPLQATHTVVGHRRAVLSVTATNEVLFSGSKDGTAKIWDLTRCQEVFSLNDHPDSVNVVRYDEFNKLIFTCSKSIIKIWDPRQNPDINCIKTLCSSGLMLENQTNNESFIYDMRLSADGSTLFSTAERLVRVWDLKTFQTIGKLNTGHKSFVTCLAVDDDEINDTRLVITGSKDHTVKVFELDNNINGIHIPRYTLKPPHYDGIEALRLTNKGQCLFSGGRDGCIKKWSLTEQRCVASLGNCHRDWVLALDTFLQGTILLSANRSGLLRVWGIENCHSFGEIQAHSMAINDIATIPQAVFTASTDCTINLWQHRESTSPIIIDDNE